MVVGFGRLWSFVVVIVVVIVVVVVGSSTEEYRRVESRV
jgi:hypothetical protein